MFRLSFAALILVMGPAQSMAQLPEEFLGRWEMSSSYYGNTNWYDEIPPNERVQISIRELYLRVRQPSRDEPITLDIQTEPHPSLPDSWIVTSSPLHPGWEAWPFATSCDPVVLRYWTEPRVIPQQGDPLIICADPPCIQLYEIGSSCADGGDHWFTPAFDPLDGAELSWSAVKSRF